METTNDYQEMGSQQQTDDLPFTSSHHDRNRSLPTSNFHHDPQRVQLNRAATTAGKHDISKPYGINPSFNPDLSIPTTPQMPESFQYPPAQQIQMPTQFTSGEIQMPDPGAFNKLSGKGMTQGMIMPEQGQLPILDLSAASTINIPDIVNTSSYGSPVQQNPAHFEDASARAGIANSSLPQPKQKPSNDGKSLSEYALHILFTQVR